MRSPSPIARLSILVALAALGFVVYLVLDASNLLLTLQDGKLIQAYIKATGNFGPVVVILFMTVAILVSPLPSAPVAIAAGTLYGHVWGTVYVITGSLFGASGAFFIARFLGYQAIQKMVEDYFPLQFVKSQNKLMGLVFVTRLMPFLSFDVISYGAGLTELHYWRFFLATMFGIAPASFLLAHVGAEVASAELHRISLAVLAISLVIVLPLLVRKIYRGSMKN